MDDFYAETIIGSKIEEASFEIYHDGKIKDVSIEDYRGKWLILFFYPANFTFVCPTELEELAGLYDEFKKEGAEVISFSTDTAFAHKAWKDSSPAIGKVKFPMGSDPTGEMAKMLGVYLYDEGLALRGTFILNPEGEIKSMEVNDNSIGRSAKELLRKLRAAKFVAENDGLVCPASWEPGNDTLKPGEDLIGKI
ncbi:redoxin domain-containing protein [Candidatus Parcubacteria bacterium]|nr:redoxin domain-containing protein [Candidatus Parcubacteria bacterium]